MTYKIEKIEEDAFFYLTSPRLLRERSVFISFTGRTGGASRNCYRSLNLSYNVGDDHLAVNKNRLTTSKNLDFNLKNFVSAKQVHGNKVAVVDKKDCGKGAMSYSSAIELSDGLITSDKSIVLTIFTADCLPLILVGENPVITGVIHCGWRGLAGGIIKNALKYFNAENTLAFLGPAIDSCCYEVGDEVVSALGLPAGGKKKYKVSLKDIAVEQLKKEKLPENNIYTSNFCTACNNDRFFSYRADNCKTGRQAAIAVIK